MGITSPKNVFTKNDLKKKLKIITANSMVKVTVQNRKEASYR
jgi:hypothetical protein